jgi:hypothetical protein
LREILQGNVSTAASARPPPPVSEASLSSPVKIALYRQSTTTFSSQDPLLRMSSTEVMTPDEPPSTKELVQGARPHSTSQVVSTTVAMKAGTSSPQQPGSKQTQRSSRQHSRAKKPGVAGASESELSPLVTTQMSPGSPPISTLFENVFEDSARFTVGGDSELREKSSPQPWQQLDDSAGSLETQV